MDISAHHIDLLCQKKGRFRSFSSRKGLVCYEVSRSSQHEDRAVAERTDMAGRLCALAARYARDPQGACAVTVLAAHMHRDVL